MKRSTMALVAAGAAAGTAAVVYHDTHHFVVRRYELVSDRIFRDVRLVFLSDLHDHVYGRHNRSLLDAIDRERPDFVLSGGDMITAHHRASAQRGEEATALLMTLGKRYPLIAVNGNHETKIDRLRETIGYGTRYDEYERLVCLSGTVLLRNERVRLYEYGITINGLELDLSHYRHGRLPALTVPMLEACLGEPDPGYFNLLLAHHPDYFPVYRAWGADLVLSGHIHGGIVRLPLLGGAVSPLVRLFPKYDGGRFDEGGSTMIVSRGLGTHTIPLRLFNPGELVVVSLRRAARPREGA